MDGQAVEGGLWSVCVCGRGREAGFAGLTSVNENSPRLSGFPFAFALPLFILPTRPPCPSCPSLPSPSMSSALKQLAGPLLRAAGARTMAAAAAEAPGRKVAVMGAAGGIGQPLSLLMKVRAGRAEAGGWGVGGRAARCAASCRPCRFTPALGRPFLAGLSAQRLVTSCNTRPSGLWWRRQGWAPHRAWQGGVPRRFSRCRRPRSRFPRCPPPHVPLSVPSRLADQPLRLRAVPVRYCGHARRGGGPVSHQLKGGGQGKGRKRERGSATAANGRGAGRPCAGPFRLAAEAEPGCWAVRQPQGTTSHMELAHEH